VASNVKPAMAAAIDGLRKAGVRLDEGWPPDIDPREQYEAYRYLLAAFFAFDLKDEEIEQVGGFRPPLSPAGVSRSEDMGRPTGRWERCAEIIPAPRAPRPAVAG
jgi:hypothetical protein